MPTNPVLAEAVRGNFVENRHRGAFAVVDAGGRVVASAGDIHQPVFPRSAIKSMQAVALFTTAAVARFNLDDQALALACASHHAERPHVEGVTRMLTALGLGNEDLECGAHWPNNAQARDELRASGAEPRAIHNNCSGKHAGMLAVAKALDAQTAGYVQREHPTQIAVRAAVEAIIGEPLSTDRCGTDGCSIPTWAASLATYARGFARMATGQGLNPQVADAARRLFDAATGHPYLVAGSGAFDTLVMSAFAGRLMQKAGAEGVQCGALRDKGWGYALKCDDGNFSASQAMLASLLLAIAEPDEAQGKLLLGFARQPLRNVRGAEVGELRAIDAPAGG